MANPNPKTDHLLPTRWQKGQSGNPKGRPKYSGSLTKLLAKVLQQNHLCGKDLSDDLVVAHVLVEATVANAIKGVGSPLVSTIFDRIDGKIPDAEPPAPEINMEAVAAEIRKRKVNRGRRNDADTDSNNTSANPGSDSSSSGDNH